MDQKNQTEPATNRTQVLVNSLQDRIDALEKRLEGHPVWIPAFVHRVNQAKKIRRKLIYMIKRVKS